jgi:ABC-2 type transport system ATP-binding protein
MPILVQTPASLRLLCVTISNVPDDTSLPNEQETAALSVRDLHITYCGRRQQPAINALNGIDLTIEQGQSIAMLGPNGSGKSTLMRVICGLLQPAAGSGKVEAFGSSDPGRIRQAISVVFQHTALDRHQTVREALIDQSKLYGMPRREAHRRVDDDLVAAGLADRADQLIKTLSLGLARRVDLVRAMLHRPRLLLLDEPTVGLDPTAREVFLRLIEQFRSEHSLTILLSTHLIDEADRQDRVIFLHEGKLVADDSPAALRKRLGSRMITVHEPDWQPPHGERDYWHAHAGSWVRPVSNDGDEAARLAGDLARADVSCTIAPPTLADVFEHLTGSRLVASPTEQSEQEAA